MDAIIHGDGFKTILMDPPWQYRDKSCQGAAELQYPTMSIESLKALPVAELAAKDAHLYLWATNPFIVDGSARELVEAYGFVGITLITWIKTTEPESPCMFSGDVTPATRMGLGRYFRSSTEHILFCVRGNARRINVTNAKNIIYAPISKHSRKPEASYRLIERCSDGPYLELFARRRRKNWDVIGNEIDGKNIQDTFESLREMFK